MVTKKQRRRQIVEDHARDILGNCKCIAQDAAEYREMYKSAPDKLPPCMNCPDFVIYYCAEEDFICDDFEIHMDIKKKERP